MTAVEVQIIEDFLPSNNGLDLQLNRLLGSRLLLVLSIRILFVATRDLRTSSECNVSLY